MEFDARTACFLLLILNIISDIGFLIHIHDLEQQVKKLVEKE